MLSCLLPLVVAATTFSPQVSYSLSGDAPGTVKLEQGVLSEPLDGELVSAARTWAMAQGAHLGLSAEVSLVAGPARSTRFGASFRFSARAHGLDVYGQQVVVTIDQTRRVVQVASSVVPAASIDTRLALDATQGLRAAGQAVPFPVLRPGGALVPDGAAQPMLIDVGGALHAAWLTHVPTVDGPHNWYVMVDGTDGTVLFAQDRVYRASALSAQVYPVSPGGLDAGVGLTPTVAAALLHADGGSMVLPSDGGVLDGDQLVAWNCCPTKDCSLSPDAGPKRSTGTTTVAGQALAFDVAVCDRRHRASNDPAVHASGDFTYTPVDPPQGAAITMADPANSDEFAEVHAFFHVNRVYDWVKGLSAAAQAMPGGSAIKPFVMRDELRTPAKKTAVWANVMFPNYNEVIGHFPCGFAGMPACRADTLTRVDNAAFMPVEQFAQIPFPEYNLGVDTLMIFQGNAADAAYDATVLEHEFGHGVVNTAAGLKLDAIAMDARSANNESGALHEGFADFIAGAFNDLAEVGPYFGPRALAGSGQPGVSNESFLRTMNNTYSCPSVLWGEVHQDSQHVSASLWKARTGPFAGSDHGATFDAAFYGMLVSITPNADFAMVAAAMSASVARAFPAVTGASALMTGIFTDKGVIGCSKVLEVTAANTPRPYYGIPTAPAGLTAAIIPGPYQMKLSAPTGVAHVAFSGTAGGAGLGGLLGGAKGVTLLVKVGSPITFAKAGNALTNDADKTLDIAGSQSGAITGILDLLACHPGQDVYVSVGAKGGGVDVSELSLQVQGPTGVDCVPDAGTPDAGSPDAGGPVTETQTVPSLGAGNAMNFKSAPGCGCTSAEGLAPFALLALAWASRRRARG